MSGAVDTPNGRQRPNYKCSRRRGGCERPQSISALIAEKWALEQGASLHIRVAADPSDSPALMKLLERSGTVEQALHELASVDARRDLGDDWLPMIRRLRAEKLELGKEITSIRRKLGVSAAPVRWDDQTEAAQFVTLRSMAPSGALVQFTERGKPSTDRLAFLIDDLEAEAVLNREQPS